jgi:hypothetical protein
MDAMPPRDLLDGGFHRSPVLYPNLYTWFVFLSAMDVMMTWVVLHWGGTELNSVADAVLQRYGLRGMVMFKFALVVVVIVLCEVAGRYKPRAGRRLARASIVITCIPVTAAFVQLLLWG